MVENTVEKRKGKRAGRLVWGICIQEEKRHYILLEGKVQRHIIAHCSVILAFVRNDKWGAGLDKQ